MRIPMQNGVDSNDPISPEIGSPILLFRDSNPRIEEQRQ
jgi:hypothetical protein